MGDLMNNFGITGVIKSANITGRVSEGGGASVVIDPTLTVAGAAADAKATGDAIAQKADEEEVSALKAYATGDEKGFIECLQSYYDNRSGFSYRTTHTAMDDNFDKEEKVIDCSTFISLCLMGTRYENSPYADGAYPPVKSEDNWSIDIKGLGVRNAADICKILTGMGCRIPFTETDNYTAETAKKDGIRNGDILFISRIGEGEEGNGRYLNITHVAAIWNTEHSYPIMEVTNSTNVVQRGSWSVRGQNIVAVCRPKYNWNNYGLSVNTGELRQELSAIKSELPDMDDYVKNTDIATSTTAGVVKVRGSGESDSLGVRLTTGNVLATDRALMSDVKQGENELRPIVPYIQHLAAFYGLAKAAGVDEKESKLAAGTYSEAAKNAIQRMIGILSSEGVGF